VLGTGEITVRQRHRRRVLHVAKEKIEAAGGSSVSQA
jgi:ribosomal protein L15